MDDMRTHDRPFAKESYKNPNDTPKLGQIALWAKSHESIIYSGNIEMEDKTKYSVNLFYPKTSKAEHTTAIYSGNISIKEDMMGWVVKGYIDFYKAKSDKLVAIGFIKWKGEEQAAMRVLLFRNNNPDGKENAPKFKGFLVENTRDEKEDRPTPKFRVNTDVKPLHKEKFDQGLF